MSQFTFDTIGLIRSPYKEKFAIPRQPGLIEDGGGELELIAPYNQPEAVRGLEEFSHLWIVFVFHQTMEGGWRPTVRPPRLGGNARMGVFATRSTFRPNPIGMSLVELKSVETKGGKVILKLGSLDLVDGTPIIDIKPYLPFAESQPQAPRWFCSRRASGRYARHFLGSCPTANRATPAALSSSAAIYPAGAGTGSSSGLPQGRERRSHLCRASARF
ncbi:putative methyltransferase, YaeB/AF_0241 family [Hafnia alvei]|uniref:Putative methyltransferase, YaeB/AF_0241 family n=1 Tax=Hafnia alvei TaxID=569 RepID=A0A377PRV0_HAFAL|nr:putative methyltransferase, YaeB/AF_0241 family [Hafnia alvei]